MVKSNKFTSKVVITEEPKKEKVKVIKGNSELVKKGEKEFKKCLKCGWLHTTDIEVCPYCGNKL